MHCKHKYNAGIVDEIWLINQNSFFLDNVKISGNWAWNPIEPSFKNMFSYRKMFNDPLAVP
jgi:hypothetical protein